MTKWWAAELDVRDVRAALRAMGTDAAREALAGMRGMRGTVNYISAGGWHGAPHIKAALAAAGARILTDYDDYDEEEL